MNWFQNARIHEIPDSGLPGACGRRDEGNSPGSRREHDRRSVSRRRRLTRPVLTAAIVAVVLPGLAPATAAGSILDLGKPLPIVSTNAYFPLSGFHHTGTLLRSNFRLELLFIGTSEPADSRSAVERWPVVKALDQFGTLSGVKVGQRTCTQQQANPPTFLAGELCTDPTFDWTRARFRSAYVDFVHIDVLNSAGKAYQKLTGMPLKLYNQYSRLRGKRPGDRYDAHFTLIGEDDGPRGMPLLDVGGYVETLSQLVHSGDFETQVCRTNSAGQSGCTYPSGLTFESTQQALISGQSPPQTTLVNDVNAEANIITALICHADGQKPGSVCGRAVIKSIARHVK